MYSLDLTTKNELNDGFRCRHEDVTEKQLMQAFKNCLNSLRKKAKAKKRQDKKNQWKYIVYAVTSNIHLSKRRKGSWHIHVLIFGSPVTAITQTIKSYWTKHCYGLPIQQYVVKCYSGGKLGYLDAQKSHCFLQSYNVTPEELGITKINRENIRKLFTKYIPPK